MVDDVDATLEGTKKVMQFALPEATVFGFQFAREGLREVEREAPRFIYDGLDPRPGVPSTEIMSNGWRR